MNAPNDLDKPSLVSLYAAAVGLILGALITLLMPRAVITSNPDAVRATAGPTRVRIT